MLGQVSLARRWPRQVLATFIPTIQNLAHLSRVKRGATGTKLNRFRLQMPHPPDYEQTTTEKKQGSAAGEAKQSFEERGPDQLGSERTCRPAPAPRRARRQHTSRQSAPVPRATATIAVVSTVGRNRGPR